MDTNTFSDENSWEWSDSEADEIIRNINEEEILDRVYGIDVRPNRYQLEALSRQRSDPETIRNINDIISNTEVQAGRGQKRKHQSDDEESESGDEQDQHHYHLEDEIQTGRGQKRKIESDDGSESDDESESEDEQGQYYYYELESSEKYHSKKFGMTATDHKVRFNNVLADFDLLQSYESTMKIFHHLLEEIKEGMAPNDKVRFILRSEQLDTPISLPFMTVEQLTTERVYSQIERVIQSNQEFRLNDTVIVDINHVVAPEGSGRLKRTDFNIRDHLKQKKSIICINNTDDLCLARALAVAIARIEKDPKYNHIRRSDRPLQRQRALDLHQAANVPLGPCGIDEVKLFQNYLINYQIIVVSGAHNNSIIYPPQPPGTDEKPAISLYYHNNHFDVITKLPGFLNRSYFCERCHKGYDHTTDHICTAMCRLCRGFGCIREGNGIACNECDRVFNNQVCYDRHKNEPINGGGRTVCQVIRKCEKCSKPMDVRKIRDGGHICGKKCETCGLILTREDTDHKCYIKPLEHVEESSYNHLLFFAFEATQEHGTHCPNLCVVHDEEKEVALFDGKDTVKKFCKWLFTSEHKDCIVVVHNFQAYDGYLITEYLIENAIRYEIIYRHAKILSLKVPEWGIRFIDSLNFIPPPLAKYPKTMGQDELCKGYFPHMINKDVDILRKSCLLYREMFRDETGIDPFNKALTNANYCHEVYRTNFLKKDTIAVFNNHRQWKTKQSNDAVTWLSYIAEKEDLYIKHVRNGGEKQFERYSLDGYCEETHTAYEYQGCYFHGKGFFP